jgi:hypothetical protein
MAMDILFFLQQRTSFISNFYVTAVTPFESIIDKIQAGVEPYVPPYSEDPEPAFMEEWVAAGTAVQVLGRTCISMLAAALKLYFTTWDKQLPMSGTAHPLGGNLVQGYLERFSHHHGIDSTTCPANLGVLEQVVLARNRTEHPVDITSLRVDHDKRTLGKYPSPFFMHEDEASFLADPSNPGQFIFDPTLHVSRKMLFEAIAEAEKLAAWLDPVLTRVRYGRPVP